MKRKFWKIFDMIALGFLLGFGLLFSAIVIIAAFNDWEVLLVFNDYHEGLSELIFVPTVTIMAIISLIRYLKRVR